MNLRELAESDLGVIMEDSVDGFGWDITLTDPAGTEVSLTGLSNDIAQIIDPDTGQAVSARLISVALRISSIIDAGLTLPEGISDSSKKPWVVQFDDLEGNSYTFKVAQSNPDRALGVVTLLLEFYKE